MPVTIAALYVEKNGCYFDLPNVIPYDADSDARMYAGPYSVIAHPPCQRWGKMWAGSPLWIKRTGERKKKGDDQGCFKSALFDVRRFGGVLEHPEHSHAWKHFGLTKPPRKGGWVIADGYGYTCRVEQGQYGHYCPKPTWLYVVRTELPKLKWGVNKVKDSDFPKQAVKKHGIAYCRKTGLMSFKGGGKDSSYRIGTPEPFRDLLISLARSVD